MTGPVETLFAYRLPENAREVVDSIIQFTQTCDNPDMFEGAVLCGGWLHRLLTEPNTLEFSTDIDIAVPSRESTLDFMKKFPHPRSSNPSREAWQASWQGMRIDVFAVDNPAARVLGFDFSCLHAMVFLDPEHADVVWLTRPALTDLMTKRATAVQPVYERRVEKFRQRGITVVAEEVLDDRAEFLESIHRRSVTPYFSPACRGNPAVLEEIAALYAPSKQEQPATAGWLP